MKNVRYIIELFIKHVSSQDILENSITYDILSIQQLFIKHIPSQNILEDSVAYDILSTQQFLKLALPYTKEYSESELENIYAAIKDMVQVECEKQFINSVKAVGSKGQPLNLFGLLLLAAEKMLQFNSNEVVCQYRYLLDWRQLTVQISEDTFTTAFCAIEDLKSRKKRTRFDWPAVIRHNNFYLNKLLQQELSDNHFHLWASSPHFNLSWIRIMNDTDNRDIRKKMSELNYDKLNVNQAYYQGYQENKFEILYLQAALIRMYLYSWFSGREIRLREYYLHEYSNKTIFQQIEEGVKLEYQKILSLLKRKKEEKNNSWLQQYRKKADKKWNKDIDCFLRGLEENGIEIPVLDGKEDITFWQCLEYAFSKCGERKEIPVAVLEPIMEERVYAMMWKNCTDETVESWLRNGTQLQVNSRNIQLAINTLRRGRGLAQRQDYALWGVPARDQTENKARWELCGERYFLYTMFQKAYQGNPKDERYLNLFYAYLVMKENLRSELIQSNKRIGFRNFQKYDRRKGMLTDHSPLENAVLKLAIEDTLSDPWLKHLEVRIVPKDTIKKNVEYIREIDFPDVKQKSLLERYYFVYHFVKEPDDTPEKLYRSSCRHERKRMQIRQQACCIVGLRERFPQVAKRVLGIDACSMEIGCRPEVFAQAFRYLKNHCVVEKWKNNDERNLPQLRVTYHVGEDFLDIVDGLRAIEEAIQFLNLDCGDRLGHVLALGLDVRNYYKVKQNVICLPKQDYLDNLAWIFSRITKYRLGVELNNLHNYVEREFSKYFSEVYGELSQKHNYNIRTYFEAWKLRGDNPQYYKYKKFDKPSWQTGTKGEYRSYGSYSMNYQYPENFHIRETEAVAYLYYAYHYDKNVKLRGQEKQEFSVPECWVEGVEILQKMLQRNIAKWGISIESNPSSNYMISVLDSYENHPIVKWYNHHLVQDPKKLSQCPQLSVSINTDDKGCFSTSLANEYALMACALEQAKDENGGPLYSRTMIYEWLDEIRKMGNLQSFQEG